MSLPPDNFGRTVTETTVGDNDIYTVSTLGDLSFPTGTPLAVVYSNINSYWPSWYTPPPQPDASQSIANTGVTIDNNNNLTATSFSSTVDTGTAPFTVVSTTVVDNLTAQYVQTNANLTGPITSVGNATAVASQTGTGSTFVMDTSPTLVTPNIGVASGTSVSLSGSLSLGTPYSVSIQSPTLTSSYTLTLPTTAGASGEVLSTDGTGVLSWIASTSGAVVSVSGTANRITSTGGYTPVIDISPNYVGQTSITTLGTITSGTWNGTTIAIGNGGTGVTSVTTTPTAIAWAGWDTNKNMSANNFVEGYTSTAMTGGTTALTVSSSYLQYFTGTGGQTVTLPNTSTLVLGQQYSIINSSSSSNLIINTFTSTNLLTLLPGYQSLITCVSTGSNGTSAWNFSSIDITPAALTSNNDTNVTLTLGGTPSTALLQATSITAGWSGQLSLSRGGTGASLTASNGGIFYSTASAGAILAGTATANQVLLSGSSAAPTWSNAVYPVSTTINQLLYSSATNTITGLATVNSAVLITNGSGVPGFSTIVPIVNGGTGVSSVTTVPVATAWAGWDASKNLSANNFIRGYTTTVTSATVVSLTVGSTYQQYFTGTIAQTVKMPDVTTLVLGQQYNVVNVSTASLTIQSSGSNTFVILPANTQVVLTCILLTGTTAASWSYYTSVVLGTATANKVLLCGTTNTAPTWSTAVYPATTTINQLLYSSAANNITGLATVNSAVLITSAGGVPGFSTTVPLANGGMGAAITASNGGIFYSTAAAGALLAGTATANKVLLSGSSAAPSWSTAVYPATTTINQLLYSSAANTITGLVASNSSVLVSNSSGVPSWAALTNGQLIIGNTGGTPTAATLTQGTGLTITNGGGSITIGLSTPVSVSNGGTGVTSITTAPAVTAWAGWDSNRNLTANNHIEGYTLTAMAGGTTALTVGSSYLQYFTGTGGQTVTLPDTSTLVLGQQYSIINSSSSSNLIINTFTSTNLLTLLPGYQTIVTCVSTGSNGASAWNASSVDVTPAALTSANDTNVTLTLGGTPSTALLQAASITAGWTGVLAPTRGGTGVNNGSYTITLGGSMTTLGSTTIPAGTLLNNVLASGNIYVGNGFGVATGVPMSGDASMNNSGSLTLSTVNSNVGSYYLTSTTVNAKGLTTSASGGMSIFAAYGPSSSVSDPSSTPTTLIGFNTPTFTASTYSYSTGVVTILISGTYEISYSLQVSSNAGTGTIIGTIGSYISVNGTLLQPTFVENTVSRQFGNNYRTANFCNWTNSFNSGDTVQLIYLLTNSTTTSMSIVNNQCTFTIKRLT